MNSEDKKALQAFKGMFAALSSSVRKKWEKRNDDTGSRQNSATEEASQLSKEPSNFVGIASPDESDYSAPNLFHGKTPGEEPPSLRSEELRQSGANIISFGGKSSSKA